MFVCVVCIVFSFKSSSDRCRCVQLIFDDHFELTEQLGDTECMQVFRAVSKLSQDQVEVLVIPKDVMLRHSVAVNAELSSLNVKLTQYDSDEFIYLVQQ